MPPNEELVNYGEALEDHRPTFGDDLEMRRWPIPMAAMWNWHTARATSYVADIQGAASVAHLYGEKLVAGSAPRRASPGPMVRASSSRWLTWSLRSASTGL